MVFGSVSNRNKHLRKRACSRIGQKQSEREKQKDSESQDETSNQLKNDLLKEIDEAFQDQSPTKINQKVNGPKAEATEPSELHHELMIKNEIKSEDIDEDYTLTSQSHPKKVIESVERESEDTEISTSVSASVSTSVSISD